MYKRQTLDSGNVQTISTDWEGIRTWDCEHPNLYPVSYTHLDVYKRQAMQNIGYNQPTHLGYYIGEDEK